MRCKHCGRARFRVLFTGKAELLEGDPSDPLPVSEVLACVSCDMMIEWPQVARNDRIREQVVEALWGRGPTQIYPIP